MQGAILKKKGAFPIGVSAALHVTRSLASRGGRERLSGGGADAQPSFLLVMKGRVLRGGRGYGRMKKKARSPS